MKKGENFKIVVIVTKNGKSKIENREARIKKVIHFFDEIFIQHLDAKNKRNVISHYKTGRAISFQNPGEKIAILILKFELKLKSIGKENFIQSANRYETINQIKE